ncbi:MAG: CotH kinase family protein [Gemmataceae bacterium]
MTSILLASALAAAGVTAGPLAPVEFSTSGGLHREPVMLTLSTKATDATIYFTTNATAPSPVNGIRYTSPVRIATTTVVRASAFHGQIHVGSEGAATFIFPEAVARQTGAGFPPTWGTREGKPVVADYEMDPDVVNAAEYRGQMTAALSTLPSLALVLDPADLFGSERGLYSHPEERGDAWERPCFAEWFTAGRANGFRVPAGLRIQGGWNRRPEESPKHSFRLVFRKKYGVGKLSYPLFGDGVKDFDQLILRGGNNHSWLHWSAAERRSADYLRDQWMRESYAAMGRLSARGCFVHLYLNGLYWGIYNLTERPDEHFAAVHLGGRDKDYDARNADKVLSGDEATWKRLFALVNAGVTNRAQSDAVGELLDLPAFCDYILLNLYGANGDWDAASNWYAARKRTGAGRFLFFVWDGERTLENVNDSILKQDDDLSPTRLFQRLRGDAGFRELFARRALQHLAGNGVLVPSKAAARYRHLADSLDAAVIAESARWGDYRRDVHQYKEGPYELYTRDKHWRPEVKRLLEDYFPNRTTVFIEQLKAAQLYPKD